MKLTKQILTDLKACTEAVDYFEVNKLEGKKLKYCIKKSLKDNHFAWCNWLVVRLMTNKQNIQYAIFAAEQVISIFEEKYPEDNRPRKAIEAAKNYLNKPNKETASAAYAAYAASAANAASAAYAAASAAYAASAAAYVSYASSAAYAASAAAYVSYASSAAYAKMKTKIINYGIKLIESKNE